MDFEMEYYDTEPQKRTLEKNQEIGQQKRKKAEMFM
jgi:hypothetical protein